MTGDMRRSIDRLDKMINKKTLGNMSLLNKAGMI
jgi:hypothetical protein